MMELAVFLSVVALVAGGLVAWRWWLQHLAQERALKTRDIDAELAKVKACEARLVELEIRLQKVEVRTAGR